MSSEGTRAAWTITHTERGKQSSTAEVIEERQAPGRGDEADVVVDAQTEVVDHDRASTYAVHRVGRKGKGQETSPPCGTFGRQL